MTTHWTICYDAADPRRLARFWAGALGYVDEPGYDFADGDLSHIVMHDPEGNEFCVA